MQALEVNVQFEITMQIQGELPFLMISLYYLYCYYLVAITCIASIVIECP